MKLKGNLEVIQPVSTVRYQDQGRDCAIVQLYRSVERSGPVNVVLAIGSGLLIAIISIGNSILNPRNQVNPLIQDRFI